MNHLIVSNSNLLIRVEPAQVAYISSDGSYSTMVLADGRQHVFSFNLSAFERLLETQLGQQSQTFIRLGKSLIINRAYIYCINLSKQELTLSATGISEGFVLSASREALKTLKSVLEGGINKGKAQS